MSKELNPYKQDTPEWQLFANMSHHLNLYRVYSEDSNRYLKMAEAQKETADKYKQALDKLKQFNHLSNLATTTTNVNNV